MGWPDLWRWWRRDATTHALVALSGMAAIGALTYTAPGTPWSDAGPPESVAAIAPAQTRSTPLNAPPTHMTETDMTAMDMTAGVSQIAQVAGHTVLFDIAPGHVGRNAVAFTVLNSDGSPAEVRGWTATAHPPGGGASIPIDHHAFAPGAVAADIELAAAGSWRLSLTFGTGSERHTVTRTLAVTAR